MKRILFFAFFAATMVLTGCKKYCLTHTHSSNSLQGTWKWSYSHGGIAAITIPSKPDSTVKLLLNNNSQYAASLNGATAVQGAYQTVSVNSLPVIQFDKPVNVFNMYLQPKEQIVRQTADSLFLFDFDISDGMHHVFVRVK